VIIAVLEKIDTTNIFYHHKDIMPLCPTPAEGTILQRSDDWSLIQLLPNNNRFTSQQTTNQQRLALTSQQQTLIVG
jgi:hypothetical protein